MQEMYCGLFEFAGVDAEVAVGGFENAFEVVEAEGIVGGEGADDAEADALVNQTIEFGEFGGSAGRVMLGASRAAAGFRGLAGWEGLATVTPRDEESEEDVEAAEAGGQKGVSPGDGGEDGEASSSMKQTPMTGTMGTEKAPPVMMPAP